MHHSEMKSKTHGIEIGVLVQDIVVGHSGGRTDTNSLKEIDRKVLPLLVH